LKKFGAMRAILTALMLMIGSPAGAECGNLCDYIWWTKATEALVKVKLDKGINPKNGYIRNNKKGPQEASLLIAYVRL
jgi:hypothetical protein